MKKSTYLIALALGASTITFAQNVGKLNIDGVIRTKIQFCILKNHSGSSLDSTFIAYRKRKSYHRNRGSNRKLGNSLI